MSNELVVKQELEKSNVPLRPGKPGENPFWNKYAKRFVYAPAFNFLTIEGATEYKFTITSDDGSVLSFTASVPWAPLTPVWDSIPHGLAHLTVEGINSIDKKTIGVSGDFKFYRAPVFKGPYNEPALKNYQEAGKEGLRGLFLSRKFQYWLSHGKPDPEVFLNCFAAKEIGASIRGMVAFSQIAKTQQEANDALIIAQKMAEFLIEQSEQKGSPLEYFPPVYWINPENKIDDWHFRVAKKNIDKMMLSEPVRAAFGFLDLYDVTREERYLEAAVNVARTYVKIQRSDGTWPLVVNKHTGKEIKSKAVVPTWILFFFERLVEQYNKEEFANVPKQITDWLLENPVKGFHWDSQFEDVEIKQPYRKMAYEQAADTAFYLFSKFSNNQDKVELAEELLRFVEDQFIVWEKPTEGWKKLEFPGGPTKYSQYDVDTWFAPAVIEQFGFVLVSRATAVVMRVYAKAYEVTHNKIYLAKAKSLANTLVYTQDFHGGGEIPSFPMSSKQIYWTNNSIYTAMFLIEFENKLDSI